ncbi:MAG: hypothetical protein JWP12_710 [Bacteroidetes bacterium]|nr:hypothetical protein [Bacteroidota bacterium]
MRSLSSILFLALFCIFYSCSPKREFPPKTDLNTYSATTFAATPEEKIDPGKNVIYSPSLLYAWDKLRKEFSVPFEINQSFPELYALNASQSHINSLPESEYETNVVREGLNISVTAFFKKSLPYETKLQRFDDPLIFNKHAVAAFGAWGSDKEMAKMFKILYYKNDSDFIISIQPKDETQEIILFKKENNNDTTLAAILNELNAKTEIGKKEQLSRDNWKYELKEDDKIVIPVLRFNIENEYKKMMRNSLDVAGMHYTITVMKQQTAFILDEIGAEVESEATTGMAGAALPPENEHPKHLIFNSSFLIVLKEKDKTNPYFAMWTVNNELMQTGIK